MFIPAQNLRHLEECLQQLNIDENNYQPDDNLLSAALQRALERSHDDLACAILKINSLIVTAEMIKIALTNINIEFLRRI